VLRVLGNLLEVSGFDYDSSEAVRDEVLGGKPEFVSSLDNGVEPAALSLAAEVSGMQRVADVPIHFADALVRRAPSLQATRDAAAPVARMNSAMLANLGVADGGQVKVGAGGTAQVAMVAMVAMVAQLDAGVPENCVRVVAAHAGTVAIGPMFGSLTVDKV
jgi:NADH-quinone oxidoreductase subunit G